MKTMIPLPIQLGWFLESLKIYRIGRDNYARGASTFSAYEDRYDLMGPRPPVRFFGLVTDGAPIFGTLYIGEHHKHDFPKDDWVLEVYGTENIPQMEELADKLYLELGAIVHTILVDEEVHTEYIRN